MPGSERWELGRYKGKELWREIMEVTDYASVVYVQRAIEMFESRVGKEATSKVKVTGLLKTVDLFSHIFVGRGLRNIYQSTNSHRFLVPIPALFPAETSPAHSGRASELDGHCAGLALASAKGCNCG